MSVRGMGVLENLLSGWQSWTCNHRWVRARWEDGSYGLRCAQCMKAYPHTWNELIARPHAAVPPAAVGKVTEIRSWRRAA